MKRGFTVSTFFVSRRFCLVVGVLVNIGAVGAAQDPQPTRITVSLPADAQLEINGRATSATGALREFRDSQAQAGSFYRYLLRVSVERNGRRISEDRLLRLRAGDQEQVAFQIAQPVVARKQLAVPADNTLAQAANFQPRFQPRTTESSQLPDLPAVGDTTDDALPPLTTDESNVPADNDLQTPQPEPALDAPTTGGTRFGRQFGAETEQSAPSDEELPPIDNEPALGEPQFNTPPVTTEAPSTAEKSLTEKPAVDLPPGGVANLLAYLGHNHMHQFIDDTGIVLHVWQNRWRMVRLQRAATPAGPYTIYNEIGHPGYDWAYGTRSLGCRDFPVFFKPGPRAAWCFVGHANRVRPFPN